MGKGERLEVRIGATDLVRLGAAAKSLGLSVSEFVRVTAVGAAERMLSDSDDAADES